jgi:tetratricopeptide (TPR) repeat protein
LVESGEIPRGGSDPAFSPGEAELRKVTADQLGAQGRIDEALREYLNAIDANPEYLPAYIGLAVTLQLAGRHDEALAAYREGLEVDPKSVEIHAAMAALLAQLGRMDESHTAQARGVLANPNAALTHQAMGEILLQKADPAGAAGSFRRALAIEPNLAGAWNSLGTALSSLGQFDEAAECFRRYLKLCPDSASGYANLVSTGKYDPSQVTQRLKLLIARPGLPASERIHAEFTLGKLLDKAGEFDEAFAHYAQANLIVKQRLEAAGHRFDAAARAAQTDQTLGAFSREFFTSRRTWGSLSELPVFVVGMPRSGTTLVEQIAASHSKVHGAGELRDMTEIAKGFGGRDIKSAAESWTPAAIRQAADRHLLRLQAMSAVAARVIDKLPGNVYRVGLIAVLFPNARIIQCRRDPHDTCLSCYFQNFVTGNLFSNDLGYCGPEYRATERLLDHWRDAVPLRILDVQYEKLVADPETESRRIIDFLGLDWEPECLEFHRNSSPVLSSSLWQVRQPIYNGSVGRWKHYEKHLGPLLQALQM